MNNTIRQKITPCIWFDDQGEAAAKFYVSIFGDAKLGNIARFDAEVARLAGKPEGAAMTVEFTLEGYNFLALNGGPPFSLNPAISFAVACASRAEIDARWSALADGGTILMPLDAYPFAERYGWLQDRFGVSWQLSLAPDAKQTITPSFLFVGDVAGRAEEAMNYYATIFYDAQVDDVFRYGESDGPDAPGTVQYGGFSLAGQHFAAMDSARDHDFAFTEAISLIIHCDGQKEVDYYWNRLTDGGEESQCAWLKDRFGVSWQVVPKQLHEMIGSDDREKAQRAVQAMLKMRKIDIADLRTAFDGTAVPSA